MKKTILMSAAKKARIALAVMAVCGMSFVGARSVFAADPLPTSDLPVKIDTNQNIICGVASKVEGISLGNSNIVIGNRITLEADENGRSGNNIVIGKDVSTKGINSIIMGGFSKSNGFNNVALGEWTKLEASRSVALGSWTVVTGNNSVAIGNESYADEENTVSVGNKEYTNRIGMRVSENYRRIVNMADGINDHDAATVGQVKSMIAAGGSSSFDGSKLNTTIQNVDVAGGYKDTATNPNADTKGTVAGAINSAYQAGKEYTDTQLTDKVGIIAGGTYVEAGKNVAENIGKLDTQVKANADDIIAANTKITAVDNKIGSLSADGTYIKKTKNVSENLVALDTQVKDNVGAITAVDNKIGSLSADGTYIKKTENVSENLVALDTQVKDNVGAITAVDNKIGSLSADGNYIKKDDNVSKNLVALDNQVNTNTTAIANKADKNLSNITAAGKDVIKNLAGNKAGEVLDDKLGTISSTNYVSASGKVNENISALDTQVKANADDIIAANTKITAVDNKIGSLSADGNYIKKDDNVSKNLVALDNQVNTNTTAIADKADKNLSNITDAGKDVIKNLAGNKAGEVLDDKLGTISSTNYVSASGKVNENISKLDTQVKANADDIIAANTKITAVDNKIGSLSADGTYIKKVNNVSANLEELDKQVNANATALTTKANVDLSNINTAGENKIKDLASIKAGEVVNVKLGAINSTHYVTTGNTVNANISALDTQLNKVDNKIGTMTDGNYIGAGNTVAGNLSALDNQLKANTDAIADKADKNLSNITDAGKNVIKDLANEKAGEVVADKLGTITSNNYVSAGNTVNANISKLDEQVKANADAINTKADKDLSNITDAGKNVIKDLAGNKAGEVVDAKLGDITSNNYVNAGNTVNANISALDKQMKVNTDNIGDTNKLTTAGLGSNLSDAVVKVNDKVGDTSKLSTANLGNNLSDAVVKVDDKTKQNAKDIEKVNGRVDELGGRVDTLGGAVSKLDTKVNKVGAGAAALAALHPMEFDSDNKLSFAAGVGNYRGTNAAAIGAFYRPSEQVMFSISGNMGNGENMVNAGVSFALDRPSKTPTTKAALVKTVVAQNEQIAALNETLAEQNEKIARLEAMVEKLAAQGK